MKMDRLIIESIEGRILLGIVSFVSIMILIGWVAINEPARMASFEEQHLARSIERGAELYAANCSTCHGTSGFGIAGRAPGLNSPHLFGYDFLAEVNNQVARLQRQKQELNDQMVTLVGEEGDNGERAALLTEVGDAETTAERRDEIVARIGEIDAQVTDIEARIAEMDVALEPLLVEREAQIAALDAAMGVNYFPELESVIARVESGEADPIAITQYLGEDSSRLLQAAWGGDLRSYLTTTLVHGRPGSGDVWSGNVMAAWAQSGGGPLRPDQIDDLVNYILNWDRGDNWTESDLFTVNQFARIHADAASVVVPEGVDVLGTNVDNALMSVAEVTGDAANGEALYNGSVDPAVGTRLGCSGCHNGGVVGPATEGTWSRTMNERLSDPALSGYTVEEYLIEAILRPNDYVVEGYASGAMLANYGDQLDAQNMADILAFLELQG